MPRLSCTRPAWMLVALLTLLESSGAAGAAGSAPAARADPEEPGAALRPPAAARRRMEWASAEGFLFWLPRADRHVVGGGGGLRLLTFSWNNFYVTSLEGAAGTGAHGMLFHVGPALGWALDLGGRDQHHLRLGAGIHFAFAVYSWPPSAIDADAEGWLCFALAPTATYLYRTSSGIVVGASAKVELPVAGVLPARYTPALLFGLSVGF